MANLRFKRLLSGGLNTDVAASVKAQEVYIAGKNLRPYKVVEDGRLSMRKIEGTRAPSPAPTFTDAAVVIGRQEDEDHSRVFYFVVDPGNVSANGIYCYFAEEDKIRIVLLNFFTADFAFDWSTDREYMIDSALNGPILYFTDDNNEPYRINVERGLLTNDATYTPVQPTDSSRFNYSLLFGQTGVTKQDVTLIRRPPQFPLLVAKKDSATDANIPDQINNFIENGRFQFTYRYRYRDGETSVPAIFSQMLTQNNDDTDESFDTIHVVFPSREEIPYEVQTIDVMVREGNTGSFYIVKRFDRSKDDDAMIDHNNGTPLNFYFFNDIRGVAVSDELAYKLFDTVPFKSKTVEVARNRTFLGNNVIDLEQEEVTLSLSVQEFSGGSLEATYIFAAVFCEDPDPGSDRIEIDVYNVVFVRIEGSGSVDVDGYYRTNLDGSGFNAEALPVNLNLTADLRVAGLELDDEALLEAWMDAEFGITSCPGESGYTSNRLYEGTQPTIYGLELSGDIFEGAQQLKSDSKYGAGLLFFDFAGRTPGVVGEAEVVTPDRDYVEATYNASVQWEIDAGQESLIPDWATHFSVVRTRNLTRSSFIQNICKELKYVEYDENQVYTYVDTYNEDTTVGVAWDASRLFADKLGYVYQEGDILKGYASDDTKVQLPVIDQAGQYVITKPTDLGDLADWASSLIEIYTPYRLDEENEFYYEIGERYRILDPGTDDRSFEVLLGSFAGDTYIKQRSLDESFLSCEAMNPNDNYFQQWNTDIGRAFITYDFKRARRRPSSIVWSETWIPGTDSNGNSAFSALDEDQLDRNIGAIQRLVLAGRGQEDGTVMLAIAEVGAASIYLGETQLFDNRGDSILATSGAVIGTKNILRGDYGTDHPESVYEEDKSVFWFDVRKGCWVRYASNQLFPISKYGIDAYAKELARRIGVGSSTKVVSGWDDRHEEYLCSIPLVPNWENELEDFTETVIDLERFNDGDVIYNLTGGVTYKITLQSTDVANYLIDYSTPDRFYLVDYTSPDPYYLVDWLVAAGEICVQFGGSDIVCLEADENGPESVTITPDSDGPLILNSSGDRPGIVLVAEYGVENPHTIFTGSPRTMVFHERADQWGPYYSFAPEMIGRVNQKLITWVNGNLYVHDDEENRNTFYGTTYDAEVSVLVNEQFSIVKVLKTLAVEANQAPDWTHCRAELPNVQSSDLVESEWVEREGVYYAAVLKDRLSPNVTGDEIAKLVAGDDLRGQYFKVAFRWEGSSQLILYLVDVGCNISYGHTPVIPTS